MRLAILFVTMGEDSTFESLDAVKQNSTMEHDLIVWNNGCRDREFIERLNGYTDNVINCTKNQGYLEAINYVFLLCPADAIMILTAGLKPSPGYMELLIKPFEDERVGIVAEYQFPTGAYIQCGEYDIPEGIDVYRRSMLDDIGGLCPSFVVWGTAQTELKLRALKKGWKVIGTPRCSEHENKKGQGKDVFKIDLIAIILLNNNYIFRVIKRMGFDYKWWDKNVLKMARPGDEIKPDDSVLY